MSEQMSSSMMAGGEEAADTLQEQHQQGGDALLSDDETLYESECVLIELNQDKMLHNLKVIVMEGMMEVAPLVALFAQWGIDTSAWQAPPALPPPPPSVSSFSASLSASAVTKASENALLVATLRALLVMLQHHVLSRPEQQEIRVINSTHLHIRPPGTYHFIIEGQGDQQGGGSRGKVIGHGSFGAVRICHLKSTSEEQTARYAIKQISLQKVAEKVAGTGGKKGAGDESGGKGGGKSRRHLDVKLFRERIAREIDNLRFVSHPHIIAYIDHLSIMPRNGSSTRDFKGGHVFLVMELGTQDMMQALMSSQGISDIDIKIAISQIGRALVYLHQCSIMHRDVKPDNIMFEKNPFDGSVRAKLTDFGLSKMAVSGGGAAAAAAQAVASNVGTRHYKAPEIESLSYDCKVDVYSLGMTLIALLGKSMPIKNGFMAIDFNYSRDRQVAGKDAAGNDFYREIAVLDKGLYWGSVFRRPDITFAVQSLVLSMCHADPVHRVSMEQAMQHEFFGAYAMSAEEIEASRAQAHAVMHQRGMLGHNDASGGGYESSALMTLSEEGSCPP